MTVVRADNDTSEAEFSWHNRTTDAYEVNVASKTQASGLYHIVLSGSRFKVNQAATNRWLHTMIAGERLGRIVAEKFRVEPDVESIYRVINAEMIVFYVFTSNQVFDIDLIKRLTRIEIALVNKRPGVSVDFEYISSILVSNKARITGDDATLIFSR